MRLLAAPILLATAAAAAAAALERPPGRPRLYGWIPGPCPARR